MDEDTAEITVRHQHMIVRSGGQCRGVGGVDAAAAVALLKVFLSGVCVCVDYALSLEMGQALRGRNQQ